MTLTSRQVCAASLLTAIFAPSLLSGCAPQDEATTAQYAIRACAEWAEVQAVAKTPQADAFDAQAALDRILTPASKAADGDFAAYGPIFAAGIALQAAYMSQDQEAGIAAMVDLDEACSAVLS